MSDSDHEQATRMFAAFDDSPVIELLAEIFPPQPLRDQYLSTNGTTDEDAFEDAHEHWREQCLGLAVDASRLLDILGRLTRAEMVRDGLLDLVERQPLPREPVHEDYLVTTAIQHEGEFVRGAYSWDHTQWQADFAQIAKERERTIQMLLQDGGSRSPYLPPRFVNDWLPADLLAVETLWNLVEQEEQGVPIRRLLSRDQRAELRAILAATNPVVQAPDPTDPAGPALYEGDAAEAFRSLDPGVYVSTSGQAEYRLVVGPGSPATASAAFPTGNHDSATLNQISQILSAPGMSAVAAVTQIGALVADTGRASARPAQSADDSLDHDGLLKDTLTRREQRLLDHQTQPPAGPSGPRHSRQI